MPWTTAIVMVENRKCVVVVPRGADSRCHGADRTPMRIKGADAHGVHAWRDSLGVPMHHVAHERECRHAHRSA